MHQEQTGQTTTDKTNKFGTALGVTLYLACAALQLHREVKTMKERQSVKRAYLWEVENIARYQG